MRIMVESFSSAKDVASCGVYKVQLRPIQPGDYFKLCPTA